MKIAGFANSLDPDEMVHLIQKRRLTICSLIWIYIVCPLVFEFSVLIELGKNIFPKVCRRKFCRLLFFGAHLQSFDCYSTVLLQHDFNRRGVWNHKFYGVKLSLRCERGFDKNFKRHSSTRVVQRKIQHCLFGIIHSNCARFHVIRRDVVAVYSQVIRTNLC